MICRECQFDNPAAFRFCGQCGSPLPETCPQCGAETPEGFRFCGQCGARLIDSGQEEAQVPPVPSASGPASEETPATTAAELGNVSEIKQVTALCCELAGAGEDGPPESEVLHVGVNLLLELARSEVGRYEGWVGQPLLRGFLALFGAPLAHEDHARRAVLAAIGLQARLREALAPAAGNQEICWTIQVGLDSGSAVVGGIDEIAVGETTDCARQLAGLAEPGSVLISERTRLMVGTDLRVADAGHLDEGLRIWRLERSSAEFLHRAPPRRTRQTPFVGRARELEVLRDLLRLAGSEEGQVAILVGEAGAGKSRLLSEFRTALEERRRVWLRGHCLSYGHGVPYLPFLEMIQRSTGIRTGDSPERVTEKLRDALVQAGVDPERTLPYLLHLLGYPAGEGLENTEPQAVKDGTFAAMRRMILSAAGRSLVVLELEDLHWIDPTSEEFLASLIEALPAARILVLATYRTGYQPSWLQKSYCTQLNLRRLSNRDSRTLVDHILGDGSLGEELATSILERGDGNPFFLEELAYSVAESGGATGYTVPGTLQGVLMARLDRLPKAHKRMLQTASVFAEGISLEMLDELWEGEPRPVALIDDLLHWEFLVRVPEEDAPVYLFRHALTRAVCYQSLLARRRVELHARVADILERLYEDRLEEVYDRLIHHYPRAGQPERTVHYLLLFAARAARSYSHAEAARALREALGHAEELPAQLRDRRLTEILLRLAESLLPLAGFAETLELFERHREAVERLDDAVLTAQYHFWLAHTHTYLGHHEETAHHAGLAIAAARDGADEAAEGKTRYVLGREGFWSGRYAEGVDNSLRAVVLLERSGEPWWQGQAYWVAGFNHFALGQMDAALEALERARDISDALADYRLDSSWSIGFVLTAMGRGDEGIEHCRRGVERSRDPLNTAVATGFLGHSLLDQGDLPGAVEALEGSIRMLRQTGMSQLESWFCSYLAEAYRQVGDLERAAEVAETGLAVARQIDFGYGEGLARRALGRIRRRQGSMDQAVADFRGALEVYGTLEMPFEIASTRLDLAPLLHEGGDAEAAERELRAARETFSDLALSDQARRVERLGARLDGSATPG